MTEKLTKDEARQGVSGVGVTPVLTISLLLALAAAIAVYIYGESSDDDGQGMTGQQTEQSTADDGG